MPVTYAFFGSSLRFPLKSLSRRKKIWANFWVAPIAKAIDIACQRESGGDLIAQMLDEQISLTPRWRFDYSDAPARPFCRKRRSESFTRFRSELIRATCSAQSITCQAWQCDGRGAILSGWHCSCVRCRAVPLAWWQAPPPWKPQERPCGRRFGSLLRLCEQNFSAPNGAPCSFRSVARSRA